MSEIRVIQSWDALNPVVYDGGEPVSTRKLERDYRQALEEIERLSKWQDVALDIYSEHKKLSGDQSLDIVTQMAHYHKTQGLYLLLQEFGIDAEQALKEREGA